MTPIQHHCPDNPLHRGMARELAGQHYEAVGAYVEDKNRVTPSDMANCIESLILNERFPCDSYEGFYIYKFDDIDESGTNRPLICIRNLATGATFHAYRWQPIDAWMRSQLEKAA